MLELVSMGWWEWLLCCVVFVMYLVVLDICLYWIENLIKVILWLVDVFFNVYIVYLFCVDEFIKLLSMLSVEQIFELDDGWCRFCWLIQMILLVVFGCIIVQMVGEGVVVVEFEGEGCLVLWLDVDLCRMVGWFMMYYLVLLVCVIGLGVFVQLDVVYNIFKFVLYYGIGYGLLCYVYVLIGCVLGVQCIFDIYFWYVGVIFELLFGDVLVQFDLDMMFLVCELILGMGYVIEFWVYWFGGLLYFDWWYDICWILVVMVEVLEWIFLLVFSVLIQEVIVVEYIEYDDSEIVGEFEVGVLVDLLSMDVG